MKYKETLEYLFSRLPMYQRVGAAAYKADLSNTIELCRLIGDPQEELVSIHIAGTNGKGSTSHMLAGILQSAGYRTGLYTSPHLKDFRERIRVNGKMIPKKKIVKFVEKNSKTFEPVAPSFFEWTVALAFDHFKKEKTEIAVIETGLGGRLDSTNIIRPLVSVITNISMDHEALLGNTIEKIAVEKAGIIKKNVPVVIGKTQKQTRQIFVGKAAGLEVPIFFADKNYKVEFENSGNKNAECRILKNGKVVIKGLKPELKGDYQSENIATVIQSAELLKLAGFKISNKAIKKGIENVVSLTRLKGRWEILGKKPLIVADTGHNEAGIKQVLKQLQSIPHKKLHFVLGMVNDKDILKILRLLPKTASYYFCKADIPRGLEVKELQKKAIETGLTGKPYDSVQEAFKSAKKAADKKDIVFVGGSTFVVAEVI
jgi:dihydrofolate synthase / folylpolyglutamate synthase